MPGLETARVQEDLCSSTRIQFVYLVLLLHPEDCAHAQARQVWRQNHESRLCEILSSDNFRNQELIGPKFAKIFHKAPAKGAGLFNIGSVLGFLPMPEMRGGGRARKVRTARPARRERGRIET